MTTFPMPHDHFANHILVASPSVLVRQRVLESLRSPVRRFEQAAGGAEALVHLESGFWQVLFLDRRLPDLNAEELSHTVRQRFPGIEVVLLDSEMEAEADTPQEKLDLLPELDADGSGDVGGENDGNEDRLLADARSIQETPLPGMIATPRSCNPYIG
jgi:CheY-like chemotaxis protein